MAPSPCKNCNQRTIPKTCESTCEKWQQYANQKKKEKESITKHKEIERYINHCLWKK